MGKTAILAIKIIGDATSAVTAMEKVDGSASSMQGTMDKASAASTVALGALGAAAVTAGNAASELQQATGAVDAVFKGYAGRIHDYAKEADDAVGLSESAYSNMASVIGSQLKNMGLSMDDTGDRTQWLIGLGADLSAQFGGTTSDAVNALSSLLRGERDPIERYGVSMNQAAIDAEKAALGLTGLTGEADKNADLQATLAILTRQTADAQGAFGRESETAAGQQQRAAAAWENAAATLGQQLLPFMTEGAQLLGEWATWAGENTELVTFLAGGIGLLAGGILAINGALKVFAAVQALQTAAQWASNAAWLASPITWIVLAIVAAVALVIAIVVLLIQNWDKVQKFGTEAWNNICKAVENFINWVKRALDWVAKLAASVVPGWVKDLLGMGDSTFTARMVSEPQAASSRMAVSSMSAETTAQPMARSFAATSASVASVPDFGSLARPANRGGDVYHVTNTFPGLVTDPEGVATTIRDVLTGSDKANGRTAPGDRR